MTVAREDVADELATYLAEVGLVDPWSDDRDSSTRWKYSDDGELYSADRLEFHMELIERRLAARTGVPRKSALGVVVTAGPPGAGKSTALASDPVLHTYRDIDADDFKDSLLMRAREDGLLDEWLARTLADDRPVAARELSSFVHAESTTIANTMRDRCLADGENIVVHGTLASSEHTDELLQQLDQYGITRMVIVDVEAPAATVIDQALGRWWGDRTSNAGGIGGRFVSPGTIQGHYESGEAESRCAANALRLRDRAESLGWAVELRCLP